MKKSLKYFPGISMLVITVLLSLNNSFAQKIDIDNFNQKYLEHLIKTGIDSLRTIKGLNALHNDSILYVASLDHARYMTGTEILAHNRNDVPEKETPHKRILYYGGNFQKTGENIAVTYAFIPVSSGRTSRQADTHTDYKTLAEAFVEGWKNSPGHYKNIITPEFNMTGVAISYNPLNHSVYGVQKFGKIESYTDGHISEFFPVEFDLPFVEMYGQPKPHRRHAWRIKPRDKIKEKDLRRHARLSSIHLQNSSMHNRGDNIIVRLGPLRAAGQFFRKRKDGIALEFIPLEHYMQDSIYYSRPALRNSACIFNGYVTRPIYRNDILSETKRQMEERYHPDLFLLFKDLPEKIINQPQQPYQVNLLMLKKNRIIERISYVNRMGNFFDLPVKTKTIPYNYDVRGASITYPPQKDTLIKRIYFERNEAEIDISRIPDLLEHLHNPEKEIKLCNIFGFASVEGTEDVNKDLYVRRAENLLNIIRNETGDSVPGIIQSRENWHMFRKQLINTEFSFLADSSENFFRRFLSYESVLNSLDNELDKQRYVLLYIIFEEKETEDKLIARVMEDYKNTFDYHNEFLKRNRAEAMASRHRRWIRSTRISRKIHIIPKVTIRKMLEQQQFLFEKALNETIPFSAIDDLPFLFAFQAEETTSQDRISIEYLSFRLVHDKRLTPQEKYDFLGFVAGLRGADPLMAINYYILTLNSEYHDGSFKPEPKPETLNGFDVPDNWNSFLLNTYIEEIGKNHEQYCLDDLKAFNHIMFLSNQYYNRPDFNFRSYRTALNFLDNYFSDTGMDEDQRYDAVLLFSLLRIDDYAFRLLESIYNNGTTNKEIIRHYIIENLRNPENHYGQVYQALLEGLDLLSREEWCGLFSHRHSVNYSILDLEIFRNLMYKHCGCE